MTENEDEKDLELEEPEDAPEIKEGEEDKTDYKALAIKNAGIAKRNKTKLDKLKLANAKKEGKEEGKKEAEKNKGFDYGQKAFLKASGIAPDEYDLVQEVMASTGKDIEAVLDSKYFQAELKERRDTKATKDATPDGSKRSTNTSRDTVEYWVDKKDDKGNLMLPPADQRELRTKVVNARIKKEKDKRQFSDTSVV